MRFWSSLAKSNEGEVGAAAEAVGAFPSDATWFFLNLAACSCSAKEPPAFTAFPGAGGGGGGGGAPITDAGALTWMTGFTWLKAGAAAGAQLNAGGAAGAHLNAGGAGGRFGAGGEKSAEVPCWPLGFTKGAELIAGTASCLRKSPRNSSIFISNEASLLNIWSLSAFISFLRSSVVVISEFSTVFELDLFRAKELEILFGWKFATFCKGVISSFEEDLQVLFWIGSEVSELVTDVKESLSLVKVHLCKMTGERLLAN